MVLTLALVEGGSLFAVVSATVLISGQSPILDWRDVAWLVGRAGALSVCFIVAFYYSDLYDLRIVRSFGKFASKLLQSFGVAFLLLAAFYGFSPGTRAAQGPFVSSLLIVLGVLLPLRAVSYSVMRSRPFVDRVLILGTGALAQQLIEEIEARPDCRLAIVGVVNDAQSPGTAISSHPIRGTLEHLDQIVREVRPARIVVALAERRGRLPVRQLLEARMQGIIVEDGVETYERLAKKIPIEFLTPSHLIFSKDFKKSRLQLAGSRALSLMVAIAGLVVCAPLLALIAIAIKLDSRGPVFFVQERVGKHARAFNLIKFCTMHPTHHTASQWVRDNNHRVTRVGKWLRKFRFDELPQFINILRGDLNLVGPRPHPVSNFDLFLKEIPYYALRSVVRPGLTGWAQIRYGYANDLSEETEKMRYDLYFIKHLSLWLDLRILIDTVKTVLFGRGSTSTTTFEALTPKGVRTR
jgi:exopolysaccharide biosynthesis polyprenyl glycosylphosphotransferase